MAESGVGERVQRLTQGAELVDEGRQVLARVEAPVQGTHLRGQRVEALEQRIELAVSYLSSLHGGIVRAG
jgi:hypothetical protein